MATVRITKDLTNGIIAIAKRKFGTRRDAIISAARDTFEKMKVDFAEDVHTALLETNDMTLEVYNSIPDGWLASRENLRVGTINDQPFHIYFENPVYDPPVRVPFKLHNTYQSANLSHPRLERYAELVERTHKQVMAVDHEYESMVTTLRQLLSQCATLKQALDIWPHLMEVLPQYAIDKHNEVREKRASTKPVVQIDTSMMTGALVKAKMAEAANR